MRSTEFEKMSQIPPKNPSVAVKVTEMGNVIEVQYMSRRNCKQTIQMLITYNMVKEEIFYYYMVGDKILK
mgnify:CR=1 FL=1